MSDIIKQLEQDKADLELAFHTSIANLNTEISGLKKDKAEMLELINAAIEWIDAVPSDTVLPAMPGFDRDWADALIARIEGK